MHLKVSVMVFLMFMSFVSFSEVKQKKSEDDGYTKYLDNLTKQLFISKILLLRKDIFSWEKVARDQKLVSSPEDFYHKILYVCTTTKCPEDLKALISSKIKDKSTDLAIAWRSDKDSPRNNFREDEFTKARFKNLDLKALIKAKTSSTKDPIGFANNTTINWDSYQSPEEAKLNDFFYKETSLIGFKTKDWNSPTIQILSRDKLPQLEVEYELEFFKYFAEDEDWILVKEDGKDWWVNKAQIINQYSVYHLMNGFFYTSFNYYITPGEGKPLTASYDDITPNFSTLDYKWIGDELWLKIKTFEDHTCGDYDPSAPTPKKFEPLINIWIKAFAPNGKFNFIYPSRGC